MELKGKKISLKPMIPKDKDDFFKLATESYGSKFWGVEEGRKKRSKKEFFEDWKDGYFNSRKPYEGQCFWIYFNKKRIGQINYNKIDKWAKKTDMDIIIGDKENLGKGLGSDALETLMRYLFEKFKLNKIWIEASMANPRAIKAYEKVGFKKEGILREEFYSNGKYYDSVRFGILKREF
jgi:RimJ/RimL family protein N-acetyltransferase